jgi:diadenosine tetraphosphate (Ap4A) HIT family hydrolase
MLVYDARHVRRLDELTRDEWQAASLELWIATRAIVQVFAPDHLNVESLGNVVAHLHWHLIPRYRHDPRWGKPIWLDAAADPVRLTEHEYGQLAARLAARLDPDRS